MEPQLSWYLALSAVLFTIGVTGVIIKRNVIAMFMCIELMLNAVNLTFVAFSSYFGDVTGQLFVFIVMTVAAAEAAVGLAMVIALFVSPVSAARLFAPVMFRNSISDLFGRRFKRSITGSICSPNNWTSAAPASCGLKFVHSGV